MSRDIGTDLTSALEDSVIYPFFAIELLFDGDNALRLWSGERVLFYEGKDWIGTGSLLNIDLVEETSEIAAKGANVSLSGVPSEVLSLALSEPYQGRKANIYFGMFDSTSGEVITEGLEPAFLLNFSTGGSYLSGPEYKAGIQGLGPSLIANPTTSEYLFGEDETVSITGVNIIEMSEIFTGYMDTMDINEGADSSTVSLSIENKLIDLERPRTARYTSSFQKSRFAGDKGLEFVEDLQDKEVYWGKSKPA